MNIIKKYFSWIQKHPLRVVFFGGWAVYFYFIWSNMLSLRSDGLYAGHPYVWADWGLHIALVTLFAYKPIPFWFSSYPVFSGEKLTYPFLSNLISSVFIRLGLPLEASMWIPSLVLSIAAIYLLFSFFKVLLRSEKQSVLASSLFLFSGGLGAFLLAAKTGLLTVLLDSSTVTTQVSDFHIETNNILSSMMIPQRAFLLGLPMGLFILHILTSTFLLDDPKKKAIPKRLVVAGILAGLLVIAHTHTFIVIVLFSIYVFLLSLQKIKNWLWYGIPAVVTSGIFYYFFLFKNVSGGSFFGKEIGWLADPGLLNWIHFWVTNWGMFFILAIAGTLLLFQRRRKALWKFSGFFWGLFILANLVRFQPQTWDNTKIFAWSYIGLAPAATYFLSWLWSTKKMFVRGAVVILCLLAVSSGLIDVVHNLDFSHKTYRMLSSDEIELSLWVRSNTSYDASFLTPELVDNPIAMIGARSVVMGYSGWVFNYGFSYNDRLQDIQAVFEDGADPIVIAKKNKASYIFVPTGKTISISQKNKVYSNGAGSIYGVE